MHFSVSQHTFAISALSTSLFFPINWHKKKSYQRSSAVTLTHAFFFPLSTSSYSSGNNCLNTENLSRSMSCQSLRQAWEVPDTIGLWPCHKFSGTAFYFSRIYLSYVKNLIQQILDKGWFGKDKGFTSYWLYSIHTPLKTRFLVLTESPGTEQ